MCPAAVRIQLSIERRGRSPLEQHPTRSDHGINRDISLDRDSFLSFPFEFAKFEALNLTSGRFR